MQSQGPIPEQQFQDGSQLKLAHTIGEIIDGKDPQFQRL
jgi:hypothetical protein